ncbi:MAG: glycoside hydrolase family 3 protein [Candidatus Falkowbacteria bacterium]
MKVEIMVIILILFLFFAWLSLGRSKPSETHSRGSDEESIENILSSMSLEEKAGQMTLVAEYAIKDNNDIGKKGIGGILSGGGGYPVPNTPESWRRMINSFQKEALASRTGIPLFYGVDAVHGHNNVEGAVIFPHNIGLGASRNPELVRATAFVTAQEMLGTGANWNYAPVLSLPRDMRWGRVYESFGNDQALVSELGSHYILGLNEAGVLAAPKHYLGEGFEEWGSSKDYLLDQGAITLSEDVLLGEGLEPFEQSVKSGAMSIMVSRSSWQGVKISANKRLLTDILKERLNFKGFLVSDWGAIDQISDDDYRNTVEAINAGIDMVMVPEDYGKFIDNVVRAVNSGDIPESRINDAVERILRAKKSIGLFNVSITKHPDPDVLGNPEHRNVARRAVRESLVLLKNESVLPITKEKSVILAGRGGDDVGLQSGGWTIEWQGREGKIPGGTSILEGLKRELPDNDIIYEAEGNFTIPGKADIGIAVISEKPYAEGAGDTENLDLSESDRNMIESVKKHSKKTVLLILAGRPLMISDVIDRMDAVVMAWLPGSEGDGVTEVLYGKYDFKGKLPLAWPKSMEAVKGKKENHLFEFGYGLKYGSVAENE